jgi:hypothetical protein
MKATQKKTAGPCEDSAVDQTFKTSETKLALM